LLLLKRATRRWKAATSHRLDTLLLLLLGRLLLLRHSEVTPFPLRSSNRERRSYRLRPFFVVFLRFALFFLAFFFIEESPPFGSA